MPGVEYRQHRLSLLNAHIPDYFPFEKPQSPCRTHFSHSTLDSQCTSETQPRSKTSMWKSQLNSPRLRSESCSVHLHNHMFNILYNLFWISSFCCRCYFCLNHDQIPVLYTHIHTHAEFPAGCLALKQPVSSLLPPAWWLMAAGFYEARSFGRRRTLHRYAQVPSTDGVFFSAAGWLRDIYTATRDLVIFSLKVILQG